MNAHTAPNAEIPSSTSAKKLSLQIMKMYKAVISVTVDNDDIIASIVTTYYTCTYIRRKKHSIARAVSFMYILTLQRQGQL